MAVRGVYSDAEKGILEDFNKAADSRVGYYPRPDWVGPLIGAEVGNPVATSETMKQQAYSIDPWNPFFFMDSFAAPSRHGGLIAHPFYIERFKPGERMVKSHKGYFLTFYLMGHDFYYYQPIRPGDVIRAWAERPSLEDVTDLSGKGPRKFRYIDVRCKWINQRDELIGEFKQPVGITLYEGAPPVEKYLPDYGYTQKELDYLAEIYEKEKPRGTQLLYWEDVKVGDVTPIITNGSTTYRNAGSTLAQRMQAATPGQIQKRVFDRFVEPLGAPIEFGYTFDRKTGLRYPTHGVGRHVNDRAAQFEGGRRAWTFNYDHRWSLMRTVTNWMGNDGFLCKFVWRHIWRTPVGDAFIIPGRVTKKYVENGEHLVDARFWCLNLRGCITDFAITTVKLVSKEDEYPAYKKVLNR